MNLIQKLIGWVDERFPVIETWKSQMTEYYAPKNFNFWYFFGGLALLVLVIQILSGIFLTMNYKPDALFAFASVEYIMRDVQWGWLLRYIHSTGASMFFIVIYLHMFRGLMYGSYRKPRELLWIIGMIIYLALMGEAGAAKAAVWLLADKWNEEKQKGIIRTGNKTEFGKIAESLTAKETDNEFTKGPDDGIYDVEIKAQDQAWNVGEMLSITNLRIDRTPPVIYGQSTLPYVLSICCMAMLRACIFSPFTPPVSEC